MQAPPIIAYWKVYRYFLEVGTYWWGNYTGIPLHGGIFYGETELSMKGAIFSVIN